MLIELSIGLVPPVGLVLKAMLFAVQGEWLLQNCSVSAWPHPCHGEARGRGDHLAAGTVVGRVDADDLAERAAERGEAPEAHGEADVRDVPLALPEQEHRPLHAPAL